MRRSIVMFIVLMTAFMTQTAWANDQAEQAQAKMHVIEKADVTLVQAISNIESASGARVVKAEVDPRLKPPSLFKGPSVYGLLTVKGQEFKAYFVDVATGKVLQKYHDWLSYLMLNALRKSDTLSQAKLSLIQAIELAEKQTGGKTLEVTTNLDQGSLSYHITTIADDKLMRVTIDASSGKLTEIPTD